MTGDTDDRAYLEFEQGAPVLVTLRRMSSATGSHGEVYLVEDDGLDDIVVKLSHDPSTQRIKARVAALMAKKGSWGEHGYFYAAWPIARALHVDTRQVIGYAMPRLAPPSYYPMQIMMLPGQHKERFPDASWVRYLMVAADLSRRVAVAHSRGYVIGDLCPDNIFVTKAASVTLADVDDWQIGHPGLSHAHPCRGSRADYTPPEHMKDCSVDTFREPSSDYWALAVVIGELLFTGTRPFAGFPPGVHPSWEDRDNVETQQCWLLGADIGVTEPTPRADLLLPSQLRELFELCFTTGYGSPWRRPDPLRWADTLESVIPELRACERMPLHVYPRGRETCPWCEIVQKGLTDKFGDGFRNTVARVVDPALGSPTAPTIPTLTASMPNTGIQRKPVMLLSASSKRAAPSRRNKALTRTTASFTPATLLGILAVLLAAVLVILLLR
jgi:DNA-binding helix-hairpin-helix protein with protein kinase domain